MKCTNFRSIQTLLFLPHENPCILPSKLWLTCADFFSKYFFQVLVLNSPWVDWKFLIKKECFNDSRVFLGWKKKTTSLVCYIHFNFSLNWFLYSNVGESNSHPKDKSIACDTFMIILWYIFPKNLFCPLMINFPEQYAYFCLFQLFCCCFSCIKTRKISCNKIKNA